MHSTHNINEKISHVTLMLYRFLYQVALGSVPWRSIITSGPVWGIIVAAFASDWGLYVLLICVPLFLLDILHYEVAAVSKFVYNS